MGTRAFIGIRNVDGSVTGIYSHWDGYPSYLGRVLHENYDTWKKVIELINLGDVSIVNPRVKPSVREKHDFDKQLGDVTVAYHRDRGEDWASVAPRRYPDILDVVKNSWYDYIYIWEQDQTWYVGKVGLIEGYCDAVSDNRNVNGCLQIVKKYAKLALVVRDEEWG